jgi:tRNA uridine 5-carboxymethylaminomethyl modification enzyme
VGLIDDERYERFTAKREAIEEEIKRVESTVVPPTAEVNRLLTALGSTPISTGARLSELIRRPEVSYSALEIIDTGRPVLPKAVRITAEIQIKYEGYIKRELREVEKQKKLEDKRLPEGIDYKKILGLRLEAAEKLDKIRPVSIGQAARISGVSPADIGVILIYLSGGK